MAVSVVRLTLFYINFEGVIPAKAGIQLRNTGFRIKSGMTIKGNGFMMYYIRILVKDGEIGRMI